MNALRQAAKAVIERWDSNEYNNAYLGVHITTLRTALAVEQVQAAEHATGERAELVAGLHDAHARRWVLSPSVFSKAASMLEADAQEIAGWKADQKENLRNQVALQEQVNSLKAQQVAVPAWVPMTEKLLNEQEPWMYQPIWIAGAFGVEQATYEWRQGRYPHCFDTSDGDCRDLSEVTHAMPLTTPTHPQGDKT